MKYFFTFNLLILLSFSSFLLAQKDFTLLTSHSADNTIISVYKIESPFEVNEYQGVGYKIASPFAFTSFAIAWSSSSNKYPAGQYEIVYKVHKPNIGWTSWKTDEGYFMPGETKLDCYQTDLLFGYDEFLHDSIEFYIHSPNNETIHSILLIIQDISSSINSTKSSSISNSAKNSDCPEIPTIIPRSEWCGSYSACHNPTYAVTYRNPTHTVIHHGASPDTYTDGAAVVRSYWNYHVNTNQWSDIGYNYLFDKTGNVYQGRYNPNIPNQDVHGAHAGYANTYSIGLNFLGNSDVTLPTTIQLDKCEQFLAWWFKKKNLNPQSNANITNQAGTTTLNLPRICGHRDVNVDINGNAGTTCPGNALYAKLSEIRTKVAEKIAICNDVTAPTSTINLTPTWFTEDFTATFTDQDNLNGTGVNQKFYQVIDFDGTEWRANTNNGFFNDNFDNTIHSSWNTVSGTWNINNSSLIQTDESLANSNIYTSINQESGNIYLYNWKMRLSGSGTNRRSGMHFFCSDATQEGRGNSYMVYLRADNNTVQLYKYVNNSYNSPGTYVTGDFVIDPNIWYDVKIVFNTNNGLIQCFVNNTLAASLTDSSPFTSGNHISLRTGNCITEYEDLKVYKSRSNSVNVKIGNQANSDIRFQNPSPSLEAARLNTIINDNSNNWSSVYRRTLNIDWTAPSSVAYVNDGTSGDIDETYTLNSLSANWASSNDENSGILKYQYSVGTSAGATDIIAWTDNGLNTSFTRTGLNLAVNTSYYTNVRSINNAGLESGIVSSNGVNTRINLNCPSTQTICISASPFQLTGANPLGGTYSGQGVNSGIFNPINAGIGTHVITYSIYNQTCSYNIIVNNIPQLTCPQDIYLQNNAATLTLNQASPTGGTYFYNSTPITEFNPTLYSLGEHQIQYTYTDPNTNCTNTCNFKIITYEATQVTCPQDINICQNDAIITLQGATPIGGTYYNSNNAAITTFNPAIANIGQNTIRYTYDNNSCSFNIIVHEQPIVTCPNDINIYTNTPSFTLTGASPANGTYSINGLNISEFNPSSYSVGIHEITYTYINENCENHCSFNITINTPATVTCPNNLSICSNSDSLLLEGAMPIGGIYSINDETTQYFKPNTQNTGAHIVTYTLNGSTCQFVISNFSEPTVTCPDNLIVDISQSPFVLSGAYPANGTYSINGQTITNFDPNTIGTGTHYITYTYTNDNQCSNQCQFNIVVSNESTINSQKLTNDIIIYPNPNDGNFIIESKETFNSVTVHIINLQGDMLYNKNFNLNSTQISLNLENLKAGSYLIQLISEDKSIVKKLIIQK